MFNKKKPEEFLARDGVGWKARQAKYLLCDKISRI